MKAILIDPVKEVVEQIEIEPGLAAIYKTMDCELIECGLSLPNNEVLYVDEEGFFKEKLFVFDFLGREFVGKALLVGGDKEGNSADTTIKLEEIKEAVTFWGEYEKNF